MKFLFDVMINIEYFLCFLCVGDSFFYFKKRPHKYGKILSLLIIFIATSIWINVEIWGRFAIHMSSILTAILFIFQENLKVLIQFYLSTVAILAMMLPMFEIIINTFFILSGVVLESRIVEGITYTVLLMYIWIMGKYFRQKSPCEINKIGAKYLFFFTGILLIDAFVVVLIGDFIQSDNRIDDNLILCFAYLIIVIGILLQYVLLINAIITRNISKENELLAKQFLDNQKEHYEYLEKREIETKMFRHDIRSHLIVMKELLQNKDYDEVENYLQSIDENVNRFANYVSVNNGIADAIINKFYYDAIEKGVSIIVRGHFPMQCYVSAYDICTILSNLLSNAVIAAVECKKEKEILVDIRYTEKEIIIVVENTYEHELQSRDGEFRTTKMDASSHGFGLPNVKTCVERNNGSLSVLTEDKRFKMILSIRNEKEVNDENSSRRG